MADMYPWSKQCRVSFYETGFKGIYRKGEGKSQEMREERIG